MFLITSWATDCVYTIVNVFGYIAFAFNVFPTYSFVQIFFRCLSYLSYLQQVTLIGLIKQAQTDPILFLTRHWGVFQKKTKRQALQLRHMQKRKFWLQITPGTECPPPNLLARDQGTGTWQAEDTDFSFTHLCITWSWQSAWTIFFI